MPREANATDAEPLVPFMEDDGEEDRDAVVTAARRMLGTLNEAPVELEDARTEVRAEAGIAVYPEHGADFEELLRAADQAMFRAKKAGGEFDPAAGEGHETRPVAVTVTGGRPSSRPTTRH